MEKSGQFHFHEVELPSTPIQDDGSADIPADLTAVRGFVVSLEHQRITLDRTVQYALRNLGTASCNQENAQRMLSAAVLDLDGLDRLLSRARTAQAALEDPAARRSPSTRRLSNA